MRVTGGGSISTSYLGTECTGWATAAPDYRVRFTAGDRNLLRFYFIADEPDADHDPVLIVNDPVASYSCDDDSYDTLNPTIDFATPQGGRYDIWVASRRTGNVVPGTLYVTELDINHP